MNDHENYDRVIQVTLGKIYCCGGFKWHRLDGPAWEGKDGSKEYWVRNKKYHKTGWLNLPEVRNYFFRNCSVEHQQIGSKLLDI